MNDIDSRLRGQANQTPRRPLTKDFSDHVMEHSLAVSRQDRMSGWTSQMKDVLTTKLRVKHAGLLVGAGVVLLLSGSTYAALRWNGSDDGASYGGITKLANGDTRFWTSANDKEQCSDHQGKTFYEIKAGAKITPAQINDMNAGTCEYDDPMVLFPGVPLTGALPTGMSYKTNTIQ
jgi:hypothetical protein